MLTEKDVFGHTAFNINGIIEKLPRELTSVYKYVSVKKVVLNKVDPTNQSGGCGYIIMPLTDTKRFNKEEANLIIQKYIWNVFFGIKNKDLMPNLHYPKIFNKHMKENLDISLSSCTLQSFISLVRNAIFDKVMYLFDLNFSSIARKITGTTNVRIGNESNYEIKQEWAYWTSIHVQGQ